MVEQNNSFRETTVPVRRLTTLLACCWGSLSAYLLFHYLLVAQDVRPCLTALALLAAVWATLERKRWGRLTLLGMSRMALVLFTITLVLVAFLGLSALRPADQHLSHSFEVALNLFADNPFLAVLTLLLAAITKLWMRQPVVVADFERGKRVRLAPGQKLIARALILLWCTGILLTALLPRHQDGKPNRSAYQGVLSGVYASPRSELSTPPSASNRPVLSAASLKSR